MPGRLHQLHCTWIMYMVGGASYFSGKFPDISLWSTVSIVSFSRKEFHQSPIDMALCQLSEF